MFNPHKQLTLISTHIYTCMQKHICKVHLEMALVPQWTLVPRRPCTSRNTGAFEARLAKPGTQRTHQLPTTAFPHAHHLAKMATKQTRIQRQQQIAHCNNTPTRWTCKTATTEPKQHTSKHTEPCTWSNRENIKPNQTSLEYIQGKHHTKGIKYRNDSCL